QFETPDCKHEPGTLRGSRGCGLRETPRIMSRFLTIRAYSGSGLICRLNTIRYFDRRSRRTDTLPLKKCFYLCLKDCLAASLRRCPMTYILIVTGTAPSLTPSGSGRKTEHTH